MLLSLQNGMMMPLLLSSDTVLIGLVSCVTSHRNIWRSDILLKPVVMIRGLSPHQIARAPLMPPCPSVTCTASGARTSNMRSLRSRHVATIVLPVWSNAIDWMASPKPCSSTRGACFSMSNSLMA